MLVALTVRIVHVYARARCGRLSPTTDYPPWIVTHRKGALPMSARKSKATNATSKANAGKGQQKKSPVDVAADAIIVATDTPNEENVRHAVMLAVKLPKDSLTDTMRQFVLDNVHVPHSSVGNAESQASKAETEEKSLAERLAEVTKAKDAAKKLATKRSADEIRFVHQVTTVHRIITKRDLAAAWGMTQQQMTNLSTVARLADQLEATQDSDLVWLKTQKAATGVGPVVTQAASEAGATLRSVKTAVEAHKGEDSKAKAKAKKPADEPVSTGMEARQVLARATALLVLLNKSGDTIADVKGEQSGADITRHLRSALDAYDRKHAVPAKAEAKATPKREPAAA